ncbi:MAG: tRNA (adenosine(37)-N6)-threonylcarbamoyltransferase complex transferase subunit TsaD [Patescibacteria group bacterium]|nr:tRNA (adenosine(37)-N6)-threonylcarbamoyltransferase complex transferase subunit TsaD [Patescibacteria group bacterium]
MIVLGIETSCDETAASVVEGKGDSVRILSNVVSSQVEIHKKYNGVVPEIAAREHILNILPVINEALEKSDVNTPRRRGGATPLPRIATLCGASERGLKNIDALAVTTGPGLITSLLVGVETARTLSYAWKIPVVAVNHIEGHIYANFIGKEKIKLPALILTVSGGHTMLILMKGHGKFQTIGETRDDAAGEAFDKAAKLLNLGYPGGPIVSRTAAEFKNVDVDSAVTHPGAPRHPSREGISLPRPMLNDPNFDFSFSGLKTSLLYKIQKDKDWKNKVPEYCHEFERAVVETLVGKAIKAAKKFKVKTMMLAGGVSANLVLREEFQNAAAKLGMACHIPPLEYTTDNAAMVAAAGYFRARRKSFTPWAKLKADSNLEFK